MPCRTQFEAQALNGGGKCAGIWALNSFKARQGSFRLAGFMRSNEEWWGLPLAVLCGARYGILAKLYMGLELQYL